MLNNNIAPAFAVGDLVLKDAYQGDPHEGRIEEAVYRQFRPWRYVVSWIETGTATYENEADLVEHYDA